METIPIKSDSIYVIADGEIELSTIIPSENTKVDNLGYLCKKRPGDIVNKRQTQKEAVRKVSYKSNKTVYLGFITSHFTLKQEQTCENEVFAIKIDPYLLLAFLSFQHISIEKISMKAGLFRIYHVPFHPKARTNM
mmetsp:Transcript_68367/g.101546  ORF Transcript_68367/g.101546 Transcript_68367/m.101546 type:complete len:136 (+) Transcript_68367:687-1094(+)